MTEDDKSSRLRSCTRARKGSQNEKQGLLLNSTEAVFHKWPKYSHSWHIYSGSYFKVNWEIWTQCWFPLTSNISLSGYVCYIWSHGNANVFMCLWVSPTQVSRSAKLAFWWNENSWISFKCFVLLNDKWDYLLLFAWNTWFSSWENYL